MRVALATVVALAGCTAAADTPEPRANDGMFRDFLDGKADGDGHPLNARITPADALCPEAPRVTSCSGDLDGVAQRGELAVSARLRVDALGAGDEVVAIRVLDGDEVIAEDVLTVARVRELGAWTDAAISFHSDGSSRTVEVEALGGAEVALDYVEVFPKRFGLVLAPGSGVIADDDELSVEVPLGAVIDRVTLDDVELDVMWTRTDTAFRTIYRLRAGDLPRRDVSQLRIRAAGEAARLELRRAPAPCTYEGDPTGTPMLVTGFHPFPADGWHDNVSERAVRAVRPWRLRGVKVMRVILPVEYDRAAAAVADVIARCAPAAVISFGQGGGSIALEQTAYNLQDTGEVAGGVPDNRGVIRAAAPIDPAAPAERASTLPLDAIARALEALGEHPVRSDDPGRYICNNVFFVGRGASARAGFIHLPYTTSFDAATIARFRAVAEAAIRVTAGS